MSVPVTLLCSSTGGVGLELQVERAGHVATKQRRISRLVLPWTAAAVEHRLLGEGQVLGLAAPDVDAQERGVAVATPRPAGRAG
jgi:hypothetical protein